MIIAPKELLRDAQERHYAIPAFNFYNLDGLFAVLEAAEEELTGGADEPASIALHRPEPNDH